MIDDTLGAARLNLNWQYEVQHVETAVNLVEVVSAMRLFPALALRCIEAADWLPSRLVRPVCPVPTVL